MPHRRRARDKIVFLDAGTLDYGDVSFRELESLGKLTVYHRTTPSRIKTRLKDAAMVITNKCVFKRELLDSLPSLRAVHVTATGVDHIDLPAASARGVAVTNVAGYSTESVVQLTLGFVLALTTSLVDFNRAARRGEWCRSPFFVLPAYPVFEVQGKTLLILGYGSIGRRVAQVAGALGMKVLVAEIPGRRYSRQEKKKRVPLGRGLKKADFLTIHAPLTSLTDGLIDRAALRKMKPTAFVINMARGGIVHEEALAEALKNRSLAGAAIDVMAKEPPPQGHRLLKAPRLLITPHIAWASIEARRRLIKEVALNIRAFQQGKRRNRVV